MPLPEMISRVKGRTWKMRRSDTPPKSTLKVAYQNSENSNTEQPQTEFSEDEEGLSVVASASHNTPETEAFISKYKNATFVPVSRKHKRLITRFQAEEHGKLYQTTPSS
jgi:hypothetical protein